MALDYARSRYYEYFENGKWHEDGSSDLGRISRQQYFIRSLANEAVKSGFRNFTKVNNIINKTVDNITRDPDARTLRHPLAREDLQGRSIPAVVEMVTVPSERQFIGGAGLAARWSTTRRRRSSIGCASFGSRPPDALPEGVAPGRRPRLGAERIGCRRPGRLVFDALQGGGIRVVDPPGNADRSDYDSHRGAVRRRVRTTWRSTRRRISAVRASSSRSTRCPPGPTSSSCSAGTSRR